MCIALSSYLLIFILLYLNNTNEGGKIYKEYIMINIIPRYKAFDGSHNVDHALAVIKRSVELAELYGVSTKLAYIAAAYHDLGLELKDRELHHKYSAEIVLDDSWLKTICTQCEIDQIATAVFNHRASNMDHSIDILSKIVADSDRSEGIFTMFRRAKAYKTDRTFEDVYSYLKSKYGRSGYCQAYLPETLEMLRTVSDQLDDKDFCKSVYDMI